MHTPVILTTTWRYNHPAALHEVQQVTVGCDIDYVTAVARAGGAPVLLPCTVDEVAVAAALDVADGLLLTGGGDVLALHYGEEPHPASKYQDPTRDAQEIALAREALRRGLPILGICRGLQVLNVALGGTLVQDVPTQVPGAVQHYAHGLETVLLHHVDIEPGSRLHAIMDGEARVAVNSWHHQAARDVAPGLRVSARAKDGVIEALEAADGSPVLAVQWHPEECEGQYPQFRALFAWLVQEAGVRRATSRV